MEGKNRNEVAMSSVRARKSGGSSTGAEEVVICPKLRLNMKFSYFKAIGSASTRT